MALLDRDGSRGVVVVARYAGTVDLLADILRGAGQVVCAVAAIDREEESAVSRILRAAGDEHCLVVTVLSPSDPTLDRLQALSVEPPPVVAVTWHPADEWPASSRLARATVPAGRIRADLPDAVRAALTG